MYIAKPFRYFAIFTLPIWMAAGAFVLALGRGKFVAGLSALVTLAVGHIAVSWAVDGLDFWIRRKSRDRVWLWTHEGKEWLHTAEGQEWAAKNNYRR